jgi:ribose-phosphate pyrophosphokinase
LEGDLQVFSGRGSMVLAGGICDALGIPLGQAQVAQFPNRETRVRIEENVRGLDVYVVQSMCAPVNDNLMQLLIMVDALRRSSADRISAVIPYFGYARQEKKTAGREPISAKLVANLIQAAGADRVVTMDLHAPAIEGFFDIPVDHLRAAALLVGTVRDMDLGSEVVVGSADAGGVARAEDFSRRLGTDIFVSFKKRTSPDAVTPLQLVGDVEGRTAILVDDIISTGSSLMAAARSLKERGAEKVYACAVHPDLTEGAVEALQNSTIESVLVTDTIPIDESANGSSKIKVCTTAPLFAEAIRRIHNHESVSALFS